MKPFIQLQSLVVPVDRANVDTDALIPKQFMKSISRTTRSKPLSPKGATVFSLFDCVMSNDCRHVPCGDAPPIRLPNIHRENHSRHW